MKTAPLKTLGISVPLNKRENFTDDGFVDNLRDRVKELEDRYKVQVESSILDIADGFGLIVVKGGWLLKNIYIHIMYKRQATDIKNTYVRGHEEAHALFHLERNYLLEKRIREAGLPEPNVRLSSLEDEFFAEYGGYYALLFRGYSHEQAERLLPRH